VDDSARAVLNGALPIRVRLLFRALDLRSRGAFGREFRAIIRSQWQSAERVRELQLERLRALLAHAERFVPFYARRFAEHGVRAAGVKDFRDFERIPPVSKADVVAHADELLSTAEGGAMLTRKATGGSTGERLVFYRDAEAMARNFAHVLRNHTWAGLELGEPHAFLWGAHFDLRAQQRLTNRMVNVCLRQRWLDAFNMGSTSMQGYYQRLERWRPRLLSSYVTAATTLGEYISEQGLPPLDLAAVVTTAEVLFPERRARIEETLSKQVFDRLGCREVGNTAHECGAHDGLHVNAEHTVLEVVDRHGHAAQPGTEGEILYTTLGNYRFPLIRYRVGDYALAPGPSADCPCGRGLPKVRGVRGRISDMLTTTDGTKIHGEYFSHLFYGLETVREFRVVQEGPRELTVWLALRHGNEQLPASEEVRLRGELVRVFGPPVEVALRVVEQIPATASGKHRFTESRVGVEAS
jgi:phenylacetate-CoA ligase